MNAINFAATTRRRREELAAELIGREYVSHDEALAAFLAAAGDPPMGSAKRCRIAWELNDATVAWLRDFDHATARALRASRYAIEAGESEAEPIFRAAIRAADAILPGCHDRESLGPLLYEQWERIRRRPLSPIGRRWR
jgi:hypothetical protein